MKLHSFRDRFCYVNVQSPEAVEHRKYMLIRLVSGVPDTRWGSFESMCQGLEVNVEHGGVT